MKKLTKMTEAQYAAWLDNHQRQSDYYLQGFEANTMDQPIEDYPYTKGTTNHQQWIAGWTEGNNRRTKPL